MRAIPILLVTFACAGSEPAEAPAPAPAPAPVAPAPPPAPVDDGLGKTTDISTMSEADQQSFLMKLGEKVYKTGDGGVACVTCHGPEGKGTPGAFPPLVGQKELMKDCETHATYVLKGLQGEMVVDGVTYNSVMTPQADLLNDLQIAAVLSFERHSWGNDYGWCFPKDVAAARSK